MAKVNPKHVKKAMEHLLAACQLLEDSAGTKRGKDGGYAIPKAVHRYTKALYTMYDSIGRKFHCTPKW